MAKDLQVVKFREVLPISNVARAIGINPPSIWVTGTDFSSTISVWVNEIQCPEFVVYSNVKIIAQLPANTSVAAVKKVEVVSGRITTIQRSHVDFGVGPFYVTSGIERMVQNFVKILLQAPGSDMYNPNAGGGVLLLVGATVNSGSSEGIAASLARAIDCTSRYIIEKQTTIRNLPPDEKLLLARIDGLSSSEDTSSIAVRIYLKNMAGQTSTPSFAL
jgi:hypothetical protein